MTLKITITDAGRAELIQNSHLGFNAVTIVALDLGDAQYVPDRAQTALGNKVARLNSIAGTAVGDGILHVTGRDESAAAYNVGEFGLITDKGTLFAVCALPASAGWIIQKAAPSILLLATDVLLEEIDAEQIQFGSVEFINPPATTEMAGVVELANADEMADGTDNRRAATPAGVAQETAKRQPLSAKLTALAQLVIEANQLIYATAPDKFATAPLTAFSRTLLDDADDAAARATLKAAPLASPALTGTPTAPTAAAGTNTTQIATTAFVRAAVAALVNSSPAALDTLQELAAALGNDPNFATTMTNALAGKLGKTETAAKASSLATPITINGTAVNAGSSVTISAAATAASVMSAAAAAAFGAVGTRAYLRVADPNAAITAGATYPGSGLRTSGVVTRISSDGNIFGAGEGVAVSGTWRAMGSCAAAGGGSNYPSTEFLRIS